MSLGPAAWYCFLIILYSFVENFEVSPLVAKIAAGVGAIRAIGALTRALPGPFFVLGVPLGVAIASGTIWLFISIP